MVVVLRGFWRIDPKKLSNGGAQAQDMDFWLISQHDPTETAAQRLKFSRSTSSLIASTQKSSHAKSVVALIWL